MPTRYTNKTFGYFLTKYRRRLYRQLVQYKTLSSHLPQTIQEHSDDILRTLNIDPGVIENIELKDHAEKSCLIGLKAEFELFFYIFCIFIVHKILSDAEHDGKLAQDHEGVLKCISNVKEYYEDFVRGGFQKPKNLFIEKAMPQHGLDRMVHFLATCGLDIQKILRHIDGNLLSKNVEYNGELRPFSQVRTAFQVRHAIEHSFSKVGESFVAKVGKDWHYSSWERQFSQSGMTLGDRILVDKVDIQATGAAMSLIAGKLNEVWEEFSQSGLSGIKEKF